MELVHQWWRDLMPVGCGAFVVAKKLAGLRKPLQLWAKESFGSIKLKKLCLLQEIESLDILKESRSLLPSELVLEQSLIQSLANISKQEEIYWRQRSRLQWLKEGDGNTKFFHAVANGRKCRNLIPGFNQDGRQISDPKEIGRIFVSRFRQQFGTKRSSRLKMDFRKLLVNKQHVELTELECPFTMEKIREAVFSLRRTKPQGRMVSRCISLNNFGRRSKRTS